MLSTTAHTTRFQKANDLSDLEDRSVSLVVTSPPYPMIEMWDGSFAFPWQSWYSIAPLKHEAVISSTL
jgi:DNA modification methylase